MPEWGRGYSDMAPLSHFSGEGWRLSLGSRERSTASKPRLQGDGARVIATAERQWGSSLPSLVMTILAPQPRGQRCFPCPDLTRAIRPSLAKGWSSLCPYGPCPRSFLFYFVNSQYLFPDQQKNSQNLFVFSFFWQSNFISSFLNFIYNQYSSSSSRPKSSYDTL